jgi:predicted nuclease of predicted toxin-antitoxin system
MRFLIDASLPRSTAPLAKNLGDDAVDVRDLGMGAAPDPDIAAYAQKPAALPVNPRLRFC